MGPGDDWSFELHTSGPAEADLGTLRRLAGEGMAILKQSALARQIRTDILQAAQKAVVDYDEARARWRVYRGEISPAQHGGPTMARQ